ncbi:hypothetical protein GQ44DRAFT_752485 [Phaeosphaeriaceae sp. PMI808]|nr:hypothetical protein GQ44DRAFT_752485 [Phaeosphaeriaceae sp. PMI808]
MAQYLSELPVSLDMISYLAHEVTQVVPNISPFSSRGALQIDKTAIPQIHYFIWFVVERSRAPVPTLVTSLVYLSRLRLTLPPDANGIPSTAHRIFLAALILAAKTVNDISPSNKEWARYSAVPGYNAFGFSIAEVNLMESQFLQQLDWHVRVNPEDLYDQIYPLFSDI